MVISIGRALDNNVVFSSPSVSAHHAQLSVDGNGNVVLYDFSTNGTMVNGNIIHHSRYILRRGDSVVLPGSNKLDWEALVFGSSRGGIAFDDFRNAQREFNSYTAVNNSDLNQSPISNVYGSSPVDNCSRYYSVNSGSLHNTHNDMGFFDAVKIVLSKYAVFQGRARRKEFWYFYLFSVLCNCLFICIPFPGSIIATSLFGLIIFLPALGVMVRRLHDTNRSGLHLFFLLIPLVGPIILLVWYCTEGTSGSNQYGSDPK